MDSKTVNSEIVKLYYIFCKNSNGKCKCYKNGFFGKKYFRILNEPDDLCFCESKNYKPLWRIKKINKEEAEAFATAFFFDELKEKVKKSENIRKIVKSYERPEISIDIVERKLQQEIKSMLDDMRNIKLESDSYILLYSGFDRKIALGNYDPHIFEKLRSVGEMYLKKFCFNLKTY